MTGNVVPIERALRYRWRSEQFPFPESFVGASHAFGLKVGRAKGFRFASRRENGVGYTEVWALFLGGLQVNLSLSPELGEPKPKNFAEARALANVLAYRFGIPHVEFKRDDSFKALPGWYFPAGPGEKGESR